MHPVTNYHCATCGLKFQSSKPNAKCPRCRGNKWTKVPYAKEPKEVRLAT